jgi:hypothetical protein
MRKWTIPLLFWAFDATLENLRILYGLVHHKKTSSKKWRLEIAEYLLGPGGAPISNFLEHHWKKNSKKKGARSLRSNCSVDRCPRKTTRWCVACQLPLCEDCFNRLHTVSRTAEAPLKRRRKSRQKRKKMKKVMMKMMKKKMMKMMMKK